MPTRLYLASAIALVLFPAFACAADEAAAPASASAALTVLDRINVFGQREDVDRTAGSAHYIDEEQLQAFNYRDVNRVMRQVPGIYVVEEEGYGLRPNLGIRGSGTDRNGRITVMEDGVLIAPAPYAGPSAYYFPTMARINAVEVLKGSASVAFGPRTTGGAINLISTPVPSETAGEVDVSIGSDATLLAHGWVGTMGENFGVLLEGVRQQTDGFKALDGGRDDDTGYRLNDFMGKLRWVSSPDADRYQELELKLGRTRQDSDETYLGLTDADFAATPFRRYAASARDNIQTLHHGYELRHLIELSQRADLSTVAYRTEFERAWYKLNDVQGISLGNILADPDAYADPYAWLTGGNSPADALRVRNNNRSYYAQGIQSVLGLALGGDTVGHELEIGLRLHRDEEDRYQNDDRYMMVDGRMVQTSAGAPGTQDNRVGEAEAVSLYVQDTISFGNWILTPGLRYEHIDLTRRNYSTATGDRISPLSVSESSVSELIPGLGATWLASDRLTAFASVHKGFNPPGPGSGAEPEESVNTEIGLRWANNGTRAELVAFHVDYSNLVGTCTASTGGNCNIGDQFDGGEARVKGIEATFGHRIELGNGLAMPLQLAYTWTEAEFRNGFSSDFGEWGTVEAGDQLPYLPEHTLHAEIGLRGERWRIGLGANYLDSMRTVAGPGSAPAGERTDSALVWDLSAGYALFANAELYARVENLSDREYIVARRPAGARPGLPRSVFLGLRVGF